MMNSQDTSRRGAAAPVKGKKKASTPTGKKEAAPSLSPAGKTTPPGFAGPTSVSPKNKAAEIDSGTTRLLRHRALYTFLFYMGRSVEVTLKDQSKYTGVLDCIDPDDFTVVLKNTQRLTPGNEPFETGSTFVIQQYLLAHIATNGHPKDDSSSSSVDGAHGKPLHPGQQSSFQTDGDITNNSHAHLYGRELQTASSWLDPSLDSGDLDASRGGKTSWNQFEVNSKLFGVKNTYDENLYTTKLDKSKISFEQSKAAEKLAREIESQTSQNHHVSEERGKYTQDSIDEEARYSSVEDKVKVSTPKAASPANAKQTEAQPVVKKGLNPKAKEFKLSASASAFVPISPYETIVSKPSWMSTILPAIHRGGAPPSKGDKTQLHHNGEAERTLADEYFDRICALENENERFRGEMRHVRSLLSNNIHAREDETTSTLASLKLALAAKVQSDAAFYDTEKQKAALLFGEVGPNYYIVVRLGKQVESVELHMQQQHTALDQRLQQVTQAKSADQSMSQQQQHSHEVNVLVRDHSQSIEELRSVVASMRSTILQVKTDMEADKNERWKNCYQMDLDKVQTAVHGKADMAAWTEVEMRLQSQLERLSNRVAMDKSELLRVVEEQRDAGMSIESKRMAHMVQDTKRVADHLVGLEQLIHGETKALGQLSVSADWDHKFRTLADEVAPEVSTRSAAYQQLDDDMRSQWADLHDATRDVTVHVQSRLKDVEEIMPLEIKARQKRDDKLKKRIDGLAKSLTHVLDSLRTDVECGRNATTLRMNGIVAAQKEMADNMTKVTTSVTNRLQTVQEDTRVAMTNALDMTTQSFTQRLAADVAHSVQHLQKSIDERLELLRQGWASLDSRTQDQLAQVHAHVDKGVAEMHARLLAVYGDVEKGQVEAMQQSLVHRESFQAQLLALETVVADVRGRVASTIQSMDATWTQTFHGIRIATAVEQCVADVVAQVVDESAKQTLEYMAWSTQQGFEWQASQVSDAISAASFDARMQHQSLVRASLDEVAQQLATIDRRCHDAITGLRDDHSQVAGRVHQVQDTLVTMAWNIEERSVADTVADVLRSCVTSVANAVNAHDVVGQVQGLGHQIRQVEFKVQGLRNELEEVRQESTQKDECHRLRVSITSIHEQVNALAAGLDTMQRNVAAGVPSDDTSFAL
ncbi:hypothetical protein DYB38_000660 [Aphanomyces astaci]|uniref:LsmAD domain-containing protein n=1 Tax=Aphanomyces astaci TaxID=112090 RepID=A0A397D9I2_APHAT|nr:hypothetical protein DYB38_000660 [Aphanomyces astaci]